MNDSPTPDSDKPNTTGSHDAETQRKILNRLRRAAGQLNGVIAAVESGAECRQVVTQLAAVSSALDRAGFTIVSGAMQRCIAEPLDGADDNRERLTVEELERLFLMLS